MREGELYERERVGGLKRGSENEIVMVASGRRGSRSTRRRGKKERGKMGARRSTEPSFRRASKLSWSGSGSGFGSRAEPVYVYAVNEARARAGE